MAGGEGAGGMRRKSSLALAEEALGFVREVRRWVYHAQPSHAVDLPRLDRASELAAARCRALVKRLREEACDA